MKKIVFFLILVLALGYYFSSYEQKVMVLEKIWVDHWFLSEPEKQGYEKWELVELKFDTNSLAEFSGNISQGKKIPEIKDMVAQFKNCIPQKDLAYFSWNIALHRVLLGNRKNISIELEQLADKRLSLFAYKTSAGNKQILPEITQVFECGYTVENAKIKKLELQWNSITSDIVVWVASRSGVSSADYKLKLTEIK